MQGTTQISSQKLKYNAEVTVIKSKLGDLENIRAELGLSQRKISQLLMVDPSAWTRWVQGTTPTPPHIYRSLQWYLALIDKNSEWHPQNSFMRAFQPTNAASLKASLDDHELKIDKKLIAIQYESLLSEKKSKKLSQALTFLGLCFVIQSFVCLFLLLK